MHASDVMLYFLLHSRNARRNILNMLMNPEVQKYLATLLQSSPFIEVPLHIAVYDMSLANSVKCSECIEVTTKMLMSTGCGQKNNPLQKSHYFQNNLIFFGEIFRGYS